MKKLIKEQTLKTFLDFFKSDERWSSLSVCVECFKFVGLCLVPMLLFLDGKNQSIGVVPSTVP